MASDGGFTAQRTAFLEQVATDANLPAAACRVAILVAGYMNRETGDAFPSVETLASRLGTDRRTVQRALRSLTEARHLTVAIGTGRNHSNRYRWNVFDRKGGKSTALPRPKKGGEIAALSNTERAANRAAKGRQSVSEKGGEIAARTRDRTRDLTRNIAGPPPAAPADMSDAVFFNEDLATHFEPSARDPGPSARLRVFGLSPRDFREVFEELWSLRRWTDDECTARLALARALQRATPTELVSEIQTDHVGSSFVQWLRSREANL